MQGIEITNINLSWLPDFGAFGCDENGLNCDVVKGILPSIFDIVAQRVNMTIRHLIEPNGDWGLKPKSGPYNSTESEWTGVMGSVVNGNYHISMTQWIMNPPRYVHAF